MLGLLATGAIVLGAAGVVDADALCDAALRDSCGTDAAKRHSPFASQPCAVCAGQLQRQLKLAGCSHADIAAYCASGSGTPSPTVTVAPGVQMPIIGLGAAHFGSSTTQIVQDWIKMGGRAIDTSADYGSGQHSAERLTGVAIKQSGIAREELFLTSKIPQTELGYNSTLAVAAASLEAMDVAYLDLLLIHWPGVVGRPTADPVASRAETWRALELLHQQKKVKAIGVSNFMPVHLHELYKTAIVSPAVNQFEYHIGLIDTELLDLCEAHNITVTAYAPLGVGKVLNDAAVNQVATAHGKTAAQVAIKWLVQRGAVTIPGANTPQYMAEDLDVFSWSLSDEEMATLNALTSPGRSYNDPHRIP
jgi:2,5-diketo-D-gluconate reductase A